MEPSTRELAVLCWSLVAAVWAISLPKFRAAAFETLKIALGPVLLRFWVIVAVYACAEIYLLYRLDLWDARLLKLTGLWFVTSALVNASAALKISDEPRYFKPVLETFRIVVVIEFLTGLFTFSLPTELVLVPVATALAILVGVRSLHPEEIHVQKFLEGAQTILGLVILTAAGARAVTQYVLLSDGKLLIEFLLPAALSLLFIPAVFFAGVCSTYEWLFLKLRGERKFRRSARGRLILYLRLSPKRILAFGRQHMFELPAARTNADLTRLIVISRAQASTKPRTQTAPLH